MPIHSRLPADCWNNRAITQSTTQGYGLIEQDKFIDPPASLVNFTQASLIRIPINQGSLLHLSLPDFKNNVLFYGNFRLWDKVEDALKIKWDLRKTDIYYKLTYTLKHFISYINYLLFLYLYTINLNLKPRSTTFQAKIHWKFCTSSASSPLYYSECTVYSRVCWC